MEMSLKDMENAMEISPLPSKADEISGLLQKAERKLIDAGIRGLSSESRLEHTYTAILTCATIFLRATGYRVTDISRHHYVTIKTLQFTGKLPKQKVNYFQQIREKRHADIYAPLTNITDTELKEALRAADALLRQTRKWLKENHPELLIS